MNERAVAWSAEEEDRQTDRYSQQIRKLLFSCHVRFPILQVQGHRRPWGAAINDIRKIFRLSDPLPLCPHLELIYTAKFTQPPLPYYVGVRFSMTPSFPSMRTSHLDAPLSPRLNRKPLTNRFLVSDFPCSRSGEEGRGPNAFFPSLLPRVICVGHRVRRSLARPPAAPGQ